MAVKKSRYWNAGGEALDIETAGYALMAQIILGRTGYAGPIVTYLTNKRRGGVGFSSSQVITILKLNLSLELACSSLTALSQTNFQIEDKGSTSDLKVTIFTIKSQIIEQHLVDSLNCLELARKKGFFLRFLSHFLVFLNIVRENQFRINDW